VQIVECNACRSKELELLDGMLICPYCRSRHLPDASTGQNFEAFEKKIGLEVILEDGGPLKIAVIKIVKDLTNMGLKEAKDLVEGAPQTLMTQVTLDIANQGKQQLERAGAVVSLR